MKKQNLILLSGLIFGLIGLTACQSNGSNEESDEQNSQELTLLTGADQLDEYLPLLEGKKVGLMGNQTSIVGEDQKNLVEDLFDENVDMRSAFAYDHGYSGTVERVEKVSNEVDAETGVPLFSLYGKNEKQDSIMQSIDVMIFDLQDVGARFYTYITSLHEVMELCAKHDKELIVLDRPNPNGDQVDGPVRKSDAF